jgi:uncharacterized protein YggE
MSEVHEKRLYGLVLILVVVVALLAGFALYKSYGPSVSGPQLIAPSEKTIAVSGTGTVTLDPDVGWFMASVTTKAATASQAEEQNTAAMAKILSALKSNGIADKDIQTVEYSLSPIYQESRDPSQMPILVGYSVRHTIQVTVKDLASLGKMIDVAISNGATDIGGVYFGLSDEKAQQAQTEAIDKAVKDAAGKAKTIAESMGVKLVGPINVSLGYYYAPARMDYKAEAGPVSIMPGQLEYTVNVQITYAFN